MGLFLTLSNLRASIHTLGLGESHWPQTQVAAPVIFWECTVHNIEMSSSSDRFVLVFSFLFFFPIFRPDPVICCRWLPTFWKHSAMCIRYPTVSTFSFWPLGTCLLGRRVIQHLLTNCSRDLATQLIIHKIGIDLIQVCSIARILSAQYNLLFLLRIQIYTVLYN